MWARTLPYLAWLTQASANSAGGGGSARDRGGRLHHRAGGDADASGAGGQPRHPRRADRDELLWHQHHSDRAQRSRLRADVDPGRHHDGDLPGGVGVGAGVGAAHRRAAPPVLEEPTTRRRQAAQIRRRRDRTSSPTSSTSSSNSSRTRAGRSAAILANPSAWFPLLFFVAYQAFFIPSVGRPLVAALELCRPVCRSSSLWPLNAMTC